MDVASLFNGITKGNKSALAKGITLIESKRHRDFATADLLVTQCLQLGMDSVRIGITGVPGVGKSTFIEAFGSHLTQMGNKVAVLAVDPTSAISKGSILGDKTRMERLSKNPNAFIRPSPAQESLGGVAKKTRESIVLCEAAGFNVILVETVGVGQSETLVHSMVDFFLLLKLPGAGDELQGVKRGIMEMADAIMINKADGLYLNAAEHAVNTFKMALHLYPPKKNMWSPKVGSCSSITGTGIPEVWTVIQSFLQQTKTNGHFVKNREQQQKDWFLQMVRDQLSARFFDRPDIKIEMERLLEDVERKRISPVGAAKKLLSHSNDP